VGAVLRRQFRGLAQSSWFTQQPEPALFLDIFLGGEQALGTFWRPDGFTRLMNDAKATVDRATRRRKADGDLMVLEGMPLNPPSL